MQIDHFVSKAFDRYGSFGPCLVALGQIGGLQKDDAVLKAFNKYDLCCPQIGVLQEDNARLKAFNKYEEIERVQKLAAEETETVRRLLTAEADAARTKAASDVEAVRDSAALDAEAIRQADLADLASAVPCPGRPYTDLPLFF